MKKTIHAQSGHTMFVKSIKREELPDVIKEQATEYKKFYVVKNWDDGGHIFMYLASGYISAPSEIVVWFPRGDFWTGYGNTIQEAIDEAQKHAWKMLS